jgi:hypothetical protein
LIVADITQGVKSSRFCKSLATKGFRCKIDLLRRVSRTRSPPASPKMI